MHIPLTVKNFQYVAWDGYTVFGSLFSFICRQINVWQVEMNIERGDNCEKFELGFKKNLTYILWLIG